MPELVSMAHAHVETQHKAQLVEDAIIETKMSFPKVFPKRNLDDEKQWEKLLSNTVDELPPVCLPFPPFEDSENPATETRLTATELLEMDSRVPVVMVKRDGQLEMEPCPECPPVYCPIKSALKGVLNYDQKPYMKPYNKAV